MDRNDVTRLLKFAERIERHLGGIEKHLETLAAVLADERASIESTTAAEDIQPGAIGHVNISWTQNPELRGQRVIVTSVEASPSDGSTILVVALAKEPVDGTRRWAIPVTAFIVEEPRG